MKRFPSPGQPSISIIATSSNASKPYMGIPILRSTLYLHPSATIPTRRRRHECIMRCTLATGGGKHRSVQLTLHLTFVLNHTGVLQKILECDHPGATIIPIILSSDKTQVTVFGNKSAYPVYMTIGNIPKALRRKPTKHAQILVAYLPTTKLGHITNDASHRRTLTNLLHSCLHRLLSPLEKAGVQGVPMSSGDGVIRHTHPILASYTADYTRYKTCYFEPEYMKVN